MRVRSPVLASLAILLVAGCLEPESGGAAQTDLGEAREASLVAFRGTRAELESNVTYFLVYADARAERIVVFDDRSARVRIPPELEYPREALDEILPRTAGATNWSAGGLVLRIEEGRVSADEWANLLHVIADTWPAPASRTEDPRDDLYARAGAGGLEAALASEQEAGALAKAFDDAEAALVVERVQEPALPDQDAAPGACAQTSLRLAPTVLSPGERMEILVDVRNCGTVAMSLAAPWCAEAPFLAVDLLPVGGGVRTIPPSDATTAAYALDLRCRGDGEQLVLRPGANVTVRRHWNATLAECSGEHQCTFAPASGRYGIVAYVSGLSAVGSAEALVVDEDAPKTRLLLVRERDWVNATNGGRLQAYFGPHCAPVAYTLEPPTIGIRGSEESSGEPAPAAMVIRDWRGGPRPDNTSTVSADRLEAIALQDGVAVLKSPFDPEVVVATIRLAGDRFLVGDEPLPQGAKLTLRSERVVETADGAFHTASILEFEHVGPATAYFERVGACA